MFYADGNYLLILEGVRENLQTLFQKFSNHPSLRAPLILVDNEAEGRHFETFNISFLPRNMEDPIEDAIFLNKSTPEQLIPAQYPENVKLIVESFLQVQRVA